MTRENFLESMKDLYLTCKNKRELINSSQVFRDKYNKKHVELEGKISEFTKEDQHWILDEYKEFISRQR